MNKSNISNNSNYRNNMNKNDMNKEKYFFQKGGVKEK